MKSDARKKLVYVVSNLEKSLAFEWLADYLHLHFNLTFILLNPASSYFETFLNERSINYIRITYRGKKDFFGALAKTVKYFVLSKPDIIHTHLFDAQLVGLIAAKITGIRQRIYTRHNSNFHQKYFPSAVKYDKLSNLLATSIISISQATDKTLLELEKAPLKKIVKIPHGFKFDAFTNIKQERIEEIRLKWDIPVSGPVIGVVARQIEWKGIQYTIQAFKKYLFQFPDACLVMANATGPFQKEIYSRLEELPLSSMVQFRASSPPFSFIKSIFLKSFFISLYCSTYIPMFIQQFLRRLFIYACCFNHHIYSTIYQFIISQLHIEHFVPFNPAELNHHSCANHIKDELLRCARFHPS